MLHLLSSLEFQEPERLSWVGSRVTRYVAHCPYEIGYGIGVDPGRSFGVAVGLGEIVVVYDGIFPQQPEKWRYGCLAISLIKRIFIWPPSIPKYGVVEGAAYRATYGQVGLAEVRFGFAYGLLSVGIRDVRIAAPATIRKAVLGSGRARPSYDNWPLLTTNGTDALITLGYCVLTNTEQSV